MMGPGAFGFIINSLILQKQALSEPDSTRHILTSCLHQVFEDHHPHNRHCLIVYDMINFAAFLAATLLATASASPLVRVERSISSSISATTAATTSATTVVSSSSAFTSTSSIKSLVNPAATALAGNPSASPNPVANPGFVGTLMTADSTIARFKVLQDGIAKGNASLKFDFNPAANPATKPGAGGEALLANKANFPLVTNLGVSGGALFFAPCGLNTPHIHPRASEFFTVATSSTFNTGFVLENGLVAEQNTTLTQYQGTAFPQGSIHWQQNLSCEPAVALAGFSSDDPGASSMAQNYLVNTNGGVVQTSLGFPEQVTAENFEAFRKSIPAPFVRGMQECLQRCGLSS